MNECTCAIHLAVLENINLRVREKNPVAIFGWREIDPERSGQRHRFVPGLNLFVSVLIDVRSLLHERRRLVPGLGILLLHGGDELFGGGDLGGEGRWSGYKK